MWAHKVFVLLLAPYLTYCFTMKQGPRVRVTNKEFEVKSDLIFLETGTAVVNPDYVSIVRPFNFSNLHELDKRLETLISTHDSVCTDMAKHSVHHNRFVKAAKTPRFREQAIRICDKLGMKLPEVRNVTDAQDLARVMSHKGDNECHSGPYFETYYAEFLHNDASSARNDAITICGSHPDNMTRQVIMARSLMGGKTLVTVPIDTGLTLLTMWICVMVITWLFQCTAKFRPPFKHRSNNKSKSVSIIISI